MLDAIFIKDCIITIDALGCQIAIAENVIKEGGDYILAVKGKQKTLQQNIQDSFRFLKPNNVSESLHAGHGRVEERTCSVIKNLENIENSKDWKGIKTIIKIDSIRYFKSTKKQETSTRIYISSLDVSAENFQEYIRSHWGIENKLHWCLDVAFHEDASRKRAGDSAQNFSTINKIGLTMLKKDTLKASIMTKRLNAGWNEAYLKKLLEF